MAQLSSTLFEGIRRHIEESSGGLSLFSKQVLAKLFASAIKPGVISEMIRKDGLGPASPYKVVVGKYDESGEVDAISGRPEQTK